MKGRPSGIGLNPRSHGLPKDCCQLFGTSVSSKGQLTKKIGAAYLPVESFAYLAFYLRQHQRSGAKLIELPDWKLFFLEREGVERLLFEAHQRD